MLDTYKYRVDFNEVKYYIEIHEVLKRDLDFPDYYGRNWDAFWDCLNDMYGDPIHIEIVGLEVIERKFGDAASKMLEILKRFKHFNDDLFSDGIKIEILRGAERICLE